MRAIHCVKGFPTHNIVYLSQHFYESTVHIQGLKRRGFHEEYLLFFCKFFGFFSRHCTQMSKICFVSHQHHHNIGFCVIPKLLQPSLHVLKRHVSSYIVHNQSTNCSSVICTCNSTISVVR